MALEDIRIELEAYIEHIHDMVGEIERTHYTATSLINDEIGVSHNDGELNEMVAEELYHVSSRLFDELLRKKGLNPENLMNCVIPTSMEDIIKEYSDDIPF